ncbi:hypothetical protein L195_g010927 [Trifolium pratense]|uniref:Uncharacterized protein n=1 Tax=Trifolium pratense TaxID=57577 RepID=A0A2K3PG49_TRIPR|nr:hypothetical protein L195_g010927 [Trifolium pratense]
MMMKNCVRNRWYKGHDDDDDDDDDDDAKEACMVVCVLVKHVSYRNIRRIGRDKRKIQIKDMPDDFYHPVQFISKECAKVLEGGQPLE